MSLLVNTKMLRLCLTSQIKIPHWVITAGAYASAIFDVVHKKRKFRCVVSAHLEKAAHEHFSKRKFRGVISCFFKIFLLTRSPFLGTVENRANNVKKTYVMRSFSSPLKMVLDPFQDNLSQVILNI